MRRAAIVLALALVFALPAAASVFNCSPTAQCTGSSNKPCDACVAGSWSLCNGGIPDNNRDAGANQYTVQITSTAHVNVTCDGLTIGNPAGANAAIRVLTGGALTFSDSATGRDGNGFRNITLLPNNGGASNGAIITVAAGATVRGGAGTRIKTDTSSGNRAGIVVTGSGVWDYQGTVADSVITAVAPATTNALCGAGGFNQYYALTLKDQVAQAKVGRRIVFKSGQWRNHQLEIVSVSGRTVGVCTDLPDGTSLTCGAGATCGQRLTPHGPVGQYIDPMHWTPTISPDIRICSADGVPYPYCTGNDVGTGYVIYPQVGDAVTLVDDAWIVQTAGTVGWSLSLSAVTRGPRTSALNASGVIGIGGSTAGAGTEVGYPIEYVNGHEMPSTNIGISMVGFPNGPPLRWNAWHDEVATSGGNGGGLLFSNFSTTACPCVTDSEITDNILYRTMGNGINVNGSQYESAAQHIRVQRNLLQDGCTNTGAECNGIEINACTGCDISNNIVHDWVISTGPSLQYGACYRYGGNASVPANTARGTVFRDNIGVNCGKVGLQIDATNGDAALVTATGNYFSNTYLEGMGFAGRFIGNIVRNWDMGKQGKSGIALPVVGMGNFAIHYDDAVFSNLCGGASCYGLGMLLGSDGTYLPNPTSFNLSDNIVSRSADNNPFGIGIGSTTNATMTIAHTTVDLGGFGGTGIDFATANGQWSPTSPTTATVSDTLVTQANDQRVARCSSDAESLESLGTYMGNRSSIAAERVSNTLPIGTAADCTSAGTRFDPQGGTPTWGAGIFPGRLVMDYSLITSSPMFTAGTGGSALGARAFRFDRDRLNQVWGYGFPFDYSAGDPTGATVPPFPRNFSNGTSNVDTDGDGVMDVQDNCDLTPNPSQYDGDGDGKGCDCDKASPGAETCP